MLFIVLSAMAGAVFFSPFLWQVSGLALLAGLPLIGSLFALGAATLISLARASSEKHLAGKHRTEHSPPDVIWC